MKCRTASRDFGKAVRLNPRGRHFQPDTAPKGIDECLTSFGGFDGLYHVAGGSGRRWGDGPLHEISNEGWRLTQELNLTSVFYSNRAAVRQFLSQKTGGAIANLTSVLAFSPSGEHFATHSYAAAKAGIIGLTKSCAARYAADRIRFNALAPGLVQTSRWPCARLTIPKNRQGLCQKQTTAGWRPHRRSIRSRTPPSSFLCPMPPDYVTGQVLAVDGELVGNRGQDSTPNHDLTRLAWTWDGTNIKGLAVTPTGRVLVRKTALRPFHLGKRCGRRNVDSRFG